MRCTFCAIPGFKGDQRSKAPADIVAEVRQLVAAGVQEVILVSQNTTAYGQDFARATGDAAPTLRGTTLARLLEQICREVPDLPWLRFHYCYPGWVDEDLLQTMARLKPVVKYLDMPLQHAHPEMLRAMNRPSDVQRVTAVLARARELMPDIALRTTFIVGFPGETRAHHAAMLRFMEHVRFDHVGVFPYYAEEGTPAAAFAGQVPARTQQRRRRRALECQQAISHERNRRFVGCTLDVLVEGQADQSLGGAGQLVGRTFRDALEVDGFVLFRGAAQRGAIVPVTITGAGPYDLFGEQAGVALPLPATLAASGQPSARGMERRIGLKALPMLQPR
jgi:ribosomal protein S12 methylthiotransferase